MPHYSQRVSYRFGPGNLSNTIKTLIWANVTAFILITLAPSLAIFFGLSPVAVLEHFWIWQPLTYMFLHGSIFHVLFNMLALWMFGTELERLWGTKFFVKYYFITGIGAAATTLAGALLPFEFASQMYYSITIGASGAVYGLLLAYALYYPNRPIYMYLLFPIPAKYFVMIIGGISFLSSISDIQSGVAHTTHLGGLIIGYLYLNQGRSGGLSSELKYHYLKWKIDRLKKKFDVHQGGQEKKWDEHIH